MKKQSSSGSLNKLIAIFASIALVATFSIFVLEKSQVTDFYQKPASDATAPVRGVNDVSYTPASSTDNDEINAKKADGTVDKPATSAPDTTSPIEVTLSAATQDEAGEPLVVRTLLDNTDGGECTLVLSQNSTTKTFTKAITWQGTYYSCNFDVPYAELGVGEWSLKLTAKNGSQTGTANQTVTMEPS